jgi:hypothetical protein
MIKLPLRVTNRSLKTLRQINSVPPLCLLESEPIQFGGQGKSDGMKFEANSIAFIEIRLLMISYPSMRLTLIKQSCLTCIIAGLE